MTALQVETGVYATGDHKVDLRSLRCHCDRQEGCKFVLYAASIDENTKLTRLTREETTDALARHRYIITLDNTMVDRR